MTTVRSVIATTFPRVTGQLSVSANIRSLSYKDRFLSLSLLEEEMKEFQQGTASSSLAHGSGHEYEDEPRKELSSKNEDHILLILHPWLYLDQDLVQSQFAMSDC